MIINLHAIKPTYMSESEISGSDIYLQNEIVFEKEKKYLLKANSGHGKSSILNFFFVYKTILILRTFNHNFFFKILCKMISKQLILEF